MIKLQSRAVAGHATQLANIRQRRAGSPIPNMAKYVLLPLAVIVIALIPITAIAEIEVNMQRVNNNGVGESIGTVRLAQTEYGVELTPRLSGLSPGLHGFHLHETPDCGTRKKDGEKVVPGGAAGSHYNPTKSEGHGTPWGDGHIGDLPALHVNAEGKADHPVLAPRLTLEQVTNRSLVVHAGADNYADHPKPLGGGGRRVACGVIGAKKKPTE